jgi:hypothetical protein
MNQTEQLIKVGKAYIDALNKLDMEHPEMVYSILNILDCVHTDSGYHFGIYIEEPAPFDAPTHACDQSWFHCYQGDEEPIMRRPDKSVGMVYHYQNMLYLKFIFDIFNHLTIDKTAMGAWQAYLLSIAKTVLPFSGMLYYTKRELIFSHDQIKDKYHWLDLKRKPLLKDFDKDVSPWVRIQGTQAIVSCCYWNEWQGLVRENAKIIFFNNRVYLLEDFEEEVLFKYHCGVIF